LSAQFVLQGLQAFQAAAGEDQRPAGGGEAAGGGATEAGSGAGDEYDVAHVDFLTRAGSALHAPALDGDALESVEDELFLQQADDDHHGQAGEHVVGVELVAVLVDVPAQAALAGGGAEHQLGGDQGAPGEGPAHLEAGEDRRQRRRHQDQRHEAHALEAVVAAGHALGFGHAEEARVGAQGQRPEHRVHQHEDQAAFAQAEPQQRQRQQRDGGQRVEHGGQGGQQVAADLGGHRQGGQSEGQHDADQVAADQHVQRGGGLLQQLTAGQAVEQRLGGLQEARQQQVVVLVAGHQFPDHGQGDEDHALAQPAVLPQAGGQRQAAFQRFFGEGRQLDFVFGARGGRYGHGALLSTTGIRPGR